jgi:signal transduction histidine kinase/DNA-binding response OmpR family regulator
LYLATNNGLYRLSQFDKTNTLFKNIKVFYGDKNDLSSITSNRVYDLLFYNNTLWIGTNKLDALNLNSATFKSINTKTKPNLNNNHVYSIFKTNNFTFIGTRLGLNCIDNSTKATSIINVDNTKGKLANNVIRAINEDDYHNLWLATTNGISIIDLKNFNPKKPFIKTFKHTKNNSNSIAHNITRAIFIDYKKRTWICTYGGGINYFEENINNSSPVFNTINTKNGLSSNLVFTITQTDNKTYWIGTENGLCKMYFDNKELKNPKFITFKKDLTNQNSLKSNSVLTIFNDGKNTDLLWIGTENGLHKFDVITNEFTYFGEKNGLTNLVVYSILEDKNDFLWLSTNSGLFQFNKQTERFINYTVNDGLSNAEFNLGAKFNDKNNQLLYFGGTNGVNYFNVDNLNKFDFEGELRFTELLIKEKEINTNNNTVLTSSILNSKQINLNYNDFPTKLKFADLSFQLPNNFNYVYKLLPNDDEWNNLNSLKEIQLLNLNNGSYELLIQGKGKHNLWKKEPLKLKIEVAPPWYKSSLAYFLYLLFILSIIIAFYKVQLEKKLDQREVVRLKELNELKTKLYTNITHEFRTPLTVILGMAQNIKEKLKSSPIKVNDSIELIENNSNGLLNLVNQILDLAKIEKGKLGLNLEQDNIINHLKYITESFKSYAEENNIELVFYNETDEIIMDYDLKKVTQILKNLISNAIKFCNKNDKIIVHITSKNNNLIIKVKDTGIGISQKNLPFIFDRFYQAENNSHKNYNGTGIGLALTKDLIGLMNGSIKVKSKENMGTTFKVQIPITNTSNSATVKTAQNIKIIKKTKKPINTKLLDNDTPIALVVEDNPDVATYIFSCLENKYQTIFAINGKEGIEFAIKHTPDIIISDVMMPITDGFELCKTLKSDIATSHIPIILLTAKATQESKISGLTLGADAYLTKPFHKDELLVRMEKLIELRKILQQKYSDIKSLIVTIPKKTDTKNDEFIKKTIKMIHENMDNADFSSQQLAKALFLSNSQLYRKLKALTNDSTAIFIRKIRLQKAKELIENTSKSISEIAYETGFNDPSWFSKCYKQEFGFAPSNRG